MVSNRSIHKFLQMGLDLLRLASNTGTFLAISSIIPETYSKLHQECPSNCFLFASVAKLGFMFNRLFLQHGHTRFKFVFTSIRLLLIAPDMKNHLCPIAEKRCLLHFRIITPLRDQSLTIKEKNNRKTEDCSTSVEAHYFHISGIC